MKSREIRDFTAFTFIDEGFRSFFNGFCAHFAFAK